jgi:hypothetical protein
MMKLFSSYPVDPLVNLLWLSVASVVVLVGLRGVGGPVGLGVAVLAAIPVLLMLSGTGRFRRIAMRH